MLISVALTAGLVMSIILAALILASLAHNPRIWMGDAPKIMKDALPPLNEAEKHLRNLWAIPIFGVTFLMPLGVAFWYEQSYQPMAYGEAVLFIWLMWMCFNIIDLIVIDWLVVVAWQPAWSTIPEAKPYMQHAGYAYHFKAFLKGTVMLGVMALVLGGMVMLF